MCIIIIIPVKRVGLTVWAAAGSASEVLRMRRGSDLIVLMVCLGEAGVRACACMRVFPCTTISARLCAPVGVFRHTLCVIAVLRERGALSFPLPENEPPDVRGVWCWGC